jgi:hypothetical protein
MYEIHYKIKEDMRFILTIVLMLSTISLKSDDSVEKIAGYDFEKSFSSFTDDITVPSVYGFKLEVSTTADENKYFNGYLIKAVKEIESKYLLKGYNIHAALTHDINFNNQGFIKALKPPYTMCVAAQLELILTAYDIYSKETGDYSVYSYLPKSSYENLGAGDLRGHIWVNHDFNSYGTADALINFGMGERVVFEKLKPGAFININRKNGTGHAVMFLGYIDKSGNLFYDYNSNVIGFRYFSSQGTNDDGGFDYRNAIFSQYGCPEMNFKRDCDVIYSTDQRYLNTGMMLLPKFWKLPKPSWSLNLPPTVLDEKYFNGEVTDK